MSNKSVSIKFMNTENKEQKELVEFLKVEQTPFTIAKQWNDEQDKFNYYLLMGKYRLKEEPFLSEDEAIKEAQFMDWDKLLIVMGIMIENFNKLIEVIDEEVLKTNKDE